MHIFFLPIAVPVVSVLIPLVVDVATGSDAKDDIIVHRAKDSSL